VNITASGATITWTTTVAASSQVNYGTTSAYGSQTTLDTTMLVNHSQALTGLKAGQLYHYRVLSTDASSNLATSGDLTFTTSSTPDTTPPTVSITAPASGATVSGTVSVTANASDNVAVASVQFRVDGSSVGSPVTAAPYSYSLNTGTLSNGSHTLTAVATDTSNNTATSAGVSMTVNNAVPPPTVSMTAPASGATVSGTVSVTANAASSIGVASVQFQLDSANVGSLVTTAPYSYSWNSASAANGSHTLRAIAKDTAGTSTTSAAVTVTVNNAVPPPTVSMTAPASGATVSGTVSVTANASSSIGVASVQFQLDSANVGSLVTTAPYSFSWNTTTAANGSHTLRAIAKDTAGTSTTSVSVTVTVSNAVPPPTVSMTAPASGATVSGTVSVTANAASSIGVASVQFQLDSANVGSLVTTAPYAFSWDTTTAANGSHTWRAIAKDTAGTSTTSAAVTVTVSNAAPPPTVSITAPAPGATVSGTVSVTANASSSIGVASVQFQVDASNVGSPVTAAPYSYSLDTTTLANGSHTLTAVATDTAGTSTTSSGVIVTVSNAVNTSMGPLVQSSTNSRYFVIQGTTQAVLLSGSHTWNDFLDIGLNGSPTTFDFNGFVSFLTAHGQNATILWRKDLPVECGWINGTDVQTPWPWLRPGPGTASDGQPKWDLTQFNQAFFDRLRQRVMQLQQSGIYAIIELFDGNNVASARCGNSSPNGDGFPFTGVNNINGVDDGYTSGSTGVGSFTMTTNNAVTNAQDAFVKKTIDTLNDLPNVLWELAEEEPGNGSFFTGTSGYGGASTMQFWAPHMVGLIKAYEGGGTWEGITYPGKPFKHPVGIGAMSSQDPDDQALYSSPVDWLAPTISSNWSNQAPGTVSTNNQSKVVINDSDHSFDAATILNSDGTVNNPKVRAYQWENITDGAAGVLFMDPYDIYLPSTSPVRNTCSTPVNGICTGGPDAKYEPFRTSLGYVPPMETKLDLVKTTPQPSLSSTGFCLADAVASGAEYLVYAPNGGAFTVNLSATTHNLNVQWIDPTTGAVTNAGTVIGGSSSQSFTPPWGSSHDAVLYLVDVAGHN
jgi:hypothetical protein